MKFDELDVGMRVFETASDTCVIPGIFMVVRLDGRSFTKLTQETHSFAAPFDERFHELMVETTQHLMRVGFRAYYGYTESDEISIALHRDDSTFGRKLRKIISVLAGEASAKFSSLLGDVACFDARVSQLPSVDHVVDYFRWRAEDSLRNALNAHCYWALRREGDSAKKATSTLLGMSTSAKNELLFSRDINFNDVPAWQKRGVGVYWATYGKSSSDPRTGEAKVAERRRLKVDLNLPIRGSYADFVRDLVVENHFRNNPTQAVERGNRTDSST